MDKIATVKNNVGERITALRDEINLAKHLEGWSQLTERQQKIIEHSLYIQERAQRTGDPALQNTIARQEKTHPETLLQYYFDKGEITQDPKKRPYRYSQNHVANWLCHAAILLLEKEERFSADEPPALPREFFKAEYIQPKSLAGIEEAISKQGFPCVVHISYIPDYKTPDGKWHSLLAIGKNDIGRIIIWEKEGPGLPYRIRTLNEVYEKDQELEYSQDGLYWGVRKLRTKEDYVAS